MTRPPTRKPATASPAVARAALPRPREGAAKPASSVVAPVAAGLASPAATSMSEDEVEWHMRRIIKDLRGLGGHILAYHPWRQHARRAAEGWPDWALAGPGGVLFRELKRENKKPTRAQQEWLAYMVAAGLDAAVWRPSSVLSGQMARELATVAGLAGFGGAA